MAKSPPIETRSLMCPKCGGQSRLSPAPNNPPPSCYICPDERTLILLPSERQKLNKAVSLDNAAAAKRAEVLQSVRVRAERANQVRAISLKPQK